MLQQKVCMPWQNHQFVELRYRMGGNFGRGEFRAQNFAVKNSGESLPPPQQNFRALGPRVLLSARPTFGGGGISVF